MSEPSKLTLEEFHAYLAQVFKRTKPVPKLEERQVGAATWEAFDPKTGRVYAIYGREARRCFQQISIDDAKKKA